MRSSLRAYSAVLFALVLWMALPVLAQGPDTLPCVRDAVHGLGEFQLFDGMDPEAPETRMGGQCGDGETLHQCDVQDTCTGRHFRDNICCPSGTTGDCLVAVNGLGCVESVTAVCIEG